MSNTQRRPLYAKIAYARKQLPHMDEEAYREMLQENFGVRSGAALDMRQLTLLLRMLAEMGAVFTTGDKPAKVKPHARSDFYHVADDEFGPIKRKICAIWKRLGYDMASLNTRCKKEFGVESFAWLRDRDKLRRLVLDLEAREDSKFKKTGPATEAAHTEGGGNEPNTG